MTSKNLFFKLMKQDLKGRLWAAALISLACFFFYPVMAAFSAGMIDGYATYEKGLAAYSRELLVWVSFENWATVVGMMLASLVCGFSGFAYLNSRSKVDFYHSIPVRREKLYLATYVNGILMTAVPFAIGLILAVLIGTGNGVDAGKLWHTALVGYGLHMIYFLLLYSLAVVSVMLTGNLVVAILGNLVLTYYFPLAASLLEAYFSSFFVTFLPWDSGIVRRLQTLSPVIQYFERVGEYSNQKPVLASALAAAAVSVLLAVLGCLLYKKRPSEAAGKAMAFPATKSVIRNLISVAAALGFALFFWSMRESTGWAVFGVICGGVICHCIIEMIYHFDFKKMFSHRRQLLACIVVSLAVLFVFRYDLTGYDRYLPSEGQVKEAAVSLDMLNDWVSYGKTVRAKDGTYSWKWDSGREVMKLMEGTDIAPVLAISAEGVRQTAEQKETQEQAKGMKGREREMAVAEPADKLEAELAYQAAGALSRQNYVTVCYTLNSGRKVSRRYFMKLQPVRAEVEAVYNSDAYQKAAFPLMTRTADEVHNIRYRELGSEKRIDGLTEAQKAELLDTYRQEFAAMTLSKMETEYPVGLLRFTLKEDEEAMQWWNQTIKADNGYRYYRYESEFASRDFYPLYPSFQKTIALLEQNGVKPGSYQTEKAVDYVTVRAFVKDGNSFTFRISDSEEIQKLREATIEDGLTYYDPMFQIENHYLNFVYSEEDAEMDSDNSNAYFPAGKIPEFLQKQMEEQLKERIEKSLQ